MRMSVILAALFSMVCSANLYAKFESIKYYGVYIKDGNNYTRIKQFESWSVYFSHLEGMQSIIYKNSQSV